MSNIGMLISVFTIPFGCISIAVFLMHLSTLFGNRTKERLQELFDLSFRIPLFSGGKRLNAALFWFFCFGLAHVGTWDDTVWQTYSEAGKRTIVLLAIFGKFLIANGICSVVVPLILKLKWPLTWDLLKYLIPTKIRVELYEPAHADLINHYHETRLGCTNRYFRLWINFCFTFRTAYLLFDCWRVMALELMVPEPVKKFLGW